MAFFISSMISMQDVVIRIILACTSSIQWLCSAEHMYAIEVGLTTLASTYDSKSALTIRSIS